jgi:peptidoglycan LD-endopeptidase CwlK
MSRELSLLIPEFRTKLEQLLEACKQRGIKMSPFFTLRTPLEQAALWKQGRTATDAELKSLALENAGAHYLAECLRKVQPKETNRVTDALPGYSWHQWGEACDCAWLDSNNKITWNAEKKLGGVNGYQLYAEEAVKLGLTAGAHFTHLKDYPHVQLRSDDSPSSLGLVAIDQEMKKRFG